MDGRVMRHSVIGSCQSAATSKIVKALMVTSLTHVSSAIASTELYLYYRQLCTLDCIHCVAAVEH